MRTFSRTLSLLGLSLVAGLGTSAQVKPVVSAFVPGCDLRQLNHAYLAQLNRLRHRLNPTAAPVQFDPELFAGTVLHSARMEATDSLFHASRADLGYAAELVGAKRHVPLTEAKETARFALTQFENSEPHCRIQEDARLVFAAISATEHFYCVRLAILPGVVSKQQRAALLKLGVQPPEEGKSLQRMRYRAF